MNPTWCVSMLYLRIPSPCGRKLGRQTPFRTRKNLGWPTPLFFPLTNTARTRSDTVIFANIARLSNTKWYVIRSHTSIIGDSFQFVP